MLVGEMMRLYKNDILNILKDYNLDSNEFIILSGASLVLQDIKEYTSDIDIAVSLDLYNKILSNFDCCFEKNVNGYDVWFINNILNFSNHYYDDCEYINLFDYKLQSLDSILKLKKKLNKEKDKNDINSILSKIGK